MKIYIVWSVHRDNDTGTNDIVSYHQTLEGATRKQNLVAQQVNSARACNWNLYDEFGIPQFVWVSNPYITEAILEE
ncbi:MAG TPA: hypothetical protein PLG47_05420 [Candidatus Dojkabacteria bacterium]|nr:hypothetical protein [Candidatus Dojkabacteria bacterium]